MLRADAGASDAPDTGPDHADRLEQDADFAKSEDFRLVQLTPPGSPCSVIFGTGVTSAAPGSADGLQPGRQRLVRLGGHHPPSRPVRPMSVSYDSAADLAESLRRAAAAHGKHEEEIGHADADWPDWYALYMVQERAARGTSA